MFQIGDMLILQEMQRSSQQYEETQLAEKIILVVDIKSQPYDHYVLEFCFTKAMGNQKVVRSKEFLEQYYEIYKPKT